MGKKWIMADSTHEGNITAPYGKFSGASPRNPASPKMKRLENGASERPPSAFLPGSRPLTIEEYECLATTHPYVVKQLVASRAIIPRQRKETEYSFKRTPATCASLHTLRASRLTGNSEKPKPFRRELEEELTQHQHVAREKNSSARLTGIAPPVRHTWQDGARLHLSAKVSLALTESGAGFCKGSQSSGRRSSVDLHFAARKDCSPEGDACTRHSGYALEFSEPRRSQLRRGSVGRCDIRRKYAEDGNRRKHAKSPSCNCNAGSTKPSLGSKEQVNACRVASASPRIRVHDEARPAYSSEKRNSRAKRSLKRFEGTWRGQGGETFESEKPILHETERSSPPAVRDVGTNGDVQHELTAPMSARTKDEGHRKMLLSSFKSGKKTKPSGKQDLLQGKEDLRRLAVHSSSRRSASADTAGKEDCDYEIASFVRRRAAPVQTTTRSCRRESSTGGKATSKAPMRFPSTDSHATRTLSKTTQTQALFPPRLEEAYPVEQERPKVSQMRGAASRKLDYQHTPRISRADGTPSQSRLLDSAGRRRIKESPVVGSSILGKETSASAYARGNVQDEQPRQDAQWLESRRITHESMSGQHAEHRDVGGVHRGETASAKFSELSGEFNVPLSSKSLRADEMRSYDSSGSARLEGSRSTSRHRQGSQRQSAEAMANKTPHPNAKAKSSMHLREVFGSASSSSVMSRESVTESLSSSVRGSTGGSASSMGEAERQGAYVDRLSYGEGSKRGERSEKQRNDEDVRLSHVSGSESVTGSRSSTRTSVRSDGEVLRQSNREGAESAGRRQGSTSRKAGEEAGKRGVRDSEKALEVRSLDSAGMRGRKESLELSSASASKQLSLSAAKGRALHDEDGRHDAEECGSRRSRRESMSGQHGEPGDVSGVHDGGSASVRHSGRSSEFSVALSSKLSRGDEMRSYESGASVRRENSRRGSHRRQGSAADHGREPHHEYVEEKSSMHLREVFGSASSSSAMSRGSVKESLSSSVRGSTGGRSSSMGEAERQGAYVDRLSCGEGSKRGERSEKQRNDEDVRLSHVSGSEAVTGSRSSTRASVRSDGEVLRQSNREGAESAGRRQGSTSRKAGEEAGKRGVGDNEKALEVRSLDSAGMRGRKESLELSSATASKQLSLSAAKGRALDDEDGGHDAEECGSRRSRRESMSGQHGEPGDVSRMHGGGSASVRHSGRSSEFSVALSSKLSRGDEMRSYESSGSVRRENSRRGSQRRQGSAADDGREPHQEYVGEKSSMHLREVFGSSSNSSVMSRGSVKESLSSSVRGSTGGSASSMGGAERQGAYVDRLSYGEGSKRGERSEKQMNDEDVRLSHVSGSESVTGSRSSTRTSVRTDGEVLRQSNREGAESAGRRQGSTSRKAGEDAGKRGGGDSEKDLEVRSLDSAGMRGRGESLELSSASASKQLSLSAAKGRALHDEDGGHDAEECGSQRSRRESMSGQHGEPGDVSGVHGGGSASVRHSGRSSEFSVALSSKLSRGDEMRSYESSGSVRRENSRRGSQRRQGSAADDGREPHHEYVGEKSSMHLREVFGSASGGSAMSRGSVKESLSSSVRGSTGGSASSMGEAERQGAYVDRLSYGEGSKRGERSEKQRNDEDVRLSHVSGSESVTGSRSSTRTSVRTDGEVLRQSNREGAESAGRRQGSTSRKAGEEAGKRGVRDSEKALEVRSLDSAGMRGRGESLELSSASASKQLSLSAAKGRALHDEDGRHDAEECGSRRSRRESMSRQHGEPGDVSGVHDGGSASVRHSGRSSEFSVALSSKLSRGDEMRSYESSGSVRRENSRRESQRRQGSAANERREPHHEYVEEKSSMHLREVSGSASSSNAMSRGSVKESLSSSVRGSAGGRSSLMGEAERQGAYVDRLSYGEGSKRGERSEKQMNDEDVRLSHVSGSESVTGSRSSTRASVRSDGEVLRQSNREGAESAGRRQGSTSRKAGEEAGKRGVGDNEKALEVRSLDSAGMRGRGESLELSSASASKQLSLSVAKGRALHDEDGRLDGEECGSRRSRRESMSGQHGEPGDVSGVHDGGSASVRHSGRSSEFSVALSSKLSRGDEMRSYESSGSVRRENSGRGSQRRQGSAADDGREPHHEYVEEKSSMHLREVFGSASSSSVMSRESVKESLGSSVRDSTGGRSSSMGEAERQGAYVGRLSCGEGSKRGERSEKQRNDEDVRLSHVSGSESVTGSRSSTRTSVRTDGEVRRQSNREGAESAGRRQGSTSRKAGEEAGKRGGGDSEKALEVRSLDSAGMRGRGESLELSSASASKQLLSAANGRALHDEDGRHDGEECGSRRSRRESMSGEHGEPGDVSGVHDGGSASVRHSGRSSEFSVALSSKLSRGGEMRSYESSGSLRRENSRRESQRRQGSAPDDGREPHHEYVGEKSSMHLREVFGSASNSSAMSRGSVKESLSSSVRGSTGGRSSSMGGAERQGAYVDRLSCGEGSKRGERSEKQMNDEDVRLSHVSGSEAVTGSRSSTRTSVRTDGEVRRQSNREGAESAGRRQGSPSRKAGEEAGKRGVRDSEKDLEVRSLDSAGMRGRGESLELSSASASKQLSLSAAKGRALHDEDGRHDAEECGSQRSRRESMSGQHGEPGDVSGVHGGGSASVRHSGRSSEFSVALSSKLSRGDEMRSYGSGASVRRENSGRGSQRRQGSAADDGREPHHEYVEEKSSMHLREVFGSASSSSAMSRGSVKESLSSSVRGSTGGSSSSMGEAERQGAYVDRLSYGEGSKRGERSEKQMNDEDVRLWHAGASDSLIGSGVSTRSSLRSDAKSRRLSKRGREVCESVDLRETEMWPSAHFKNVGTRLNSWKTASNTPRASQEKAGTITPRIAGNLCGAGAQLAKSRGDSVGGLPLCSTSEDERFQKCKKASGRFFTSPLSTNSRSKAASVTPVAFKGLQTPRLGLDEEPFLRQKANVESLPSRKTQQACESGNMLWDKTTMNFSESSALDNLAHGSCNSPEMLANVLNSAVTSSKATSHKAGTKFANKPVESSGSRLLGGAGQRRSWQLTGEASHAAMTDPQCLFIEQNRRDSRNAGATPPNCRRIVTNSWASNLDESASEHSKLQRSTATGEGFTDSLNFEGSAASLRGESQTQESTTDLDTSRLIAQQDGTKSASRRSSRREELQQASDAGSTHVDSSNSRTLTATCSKRSTSSFCTAISTEPSFASDETMTPEASRSHTYRGKSAIANVGHTSSSESADADKPIAGSTHGSLSSRRRRNSAGDVESARLRADIDWRHANAGRLKRTNFPVATYSRPSYIDRTAMGRRLTAQNDMWSRVGSYEPLSSTVFHGVFPTLSSELQKLCMQCVGTPDSPELRSLTDIQKAAMALVAKQSVRKSLVAKSRIAREFKKRGQPLEALEQIERFLLTGVPILIYFDIASLTPHLAQGGYYSVRTTISASPQGAESELYLDHEPRVATLNNPWHVLEALGYDALVALAACARNPSAKLPPEVSALIDCNIHGDVKLGKDVDAIAVPRYSAHDKAMVSKLQSIATRYMVPLISMELFPRVVKDDTWKHVLRHLQHEVLLRKTSLGNTYGQI
ncbi:hypothetical protein Emag_002705 [Eimeria magna]